MFAFGCGPVESFSFVESDGHIFTYPSEPLACEYFECVKTHSHLYRLENDLSIARLIKKGDGPHPAPKEVEPTEEQKLALWQSYVYKSLLAWAPYPDEVEP